MSAVAVVTGAASGIGAATSRELGNRGHHVVVLDVRADEAGQIVDQLRHEGISAEIAVCDVSDRDAAFAAMNSIVDSHGHVDVLVNNAVNFLARGVDVTTEDWEAVLGVNVRGYSNMVQARYRAYAGPHTARSSTLPASLLTSRSRLAGRTTRPRGDRLPYPVHGARPGTRRDPRQLRESRLDLDARGREGCGWR